MHSQSLVFITFVIFAGASILSTMALFTRQSLLVAYILLGLALGPWGLKLVTDPEQAKHIGEVGIIFLLFLLGLNLQPQNLFHMLKKVTVVALLSSIIFALLGFFICRLFNFSYQDSTIVGAAIMFSSTIIGLKLLPTTILHHQHTGELMISVLLMQDLIAIIVFVLLEAVGSGGLEWWDFFTFVFGLPLLLVFAFLVERYLLVKLFARFDRTQEYIFLVSIAWCLGMAELANVMDLSEQIGAFIAGVALAENPISLYIAESLKPLRDFFLVMFFFSIGAGFNLQLLPGVAIPSIILALLILSVKPAVFYFLLHRGGESKSVSKEVGIRLGQGSEFSFLVASSAFGSSLLGDKANYLIQATTIFTFVVSSYIVVLRYPTPIALSDKLRRD